jgi:hypothetical protein
VDSQHSYGDSSTAVLNGADPCPQTFAISTFKAPATTSTQPTRQELTAPQLVALLSHHERRTDKDGPGWTPATYKPGTTRSNDNAVAWSAFAGDLDHWTAEQVQALFADLQARGLRHIIHSSHSNDPANDDYCLRVILPLARPVPAAQWSATWRRIDLALFGGRTDPQTKDAGRMFFLPSCGPDGLPFVQIGDGQPLDPDTLPAIPLDKLAVPETPAPAPATDGERERLTIGLIAASWPQAVPAGERRPSTHGDYLMPLAGFLTGHLQPDAVKELLKAAARQANRAEFLKAKRWEAEIERLVDGAAARRKSAEDDKRVRGWPWLASRFGGLATALAALYPRPTLAPPQTDPVPAPQGEPAAACSTCPLVEGIRQRDELLRQRDLELTRLRARNDQLEAENADLKQQEPERFVNRFVAMVADYQQDRSTRDLWPVALALWQYQQEHPLGDGLPWDFKDFAGRLGLDAKTQRRMLDYLHEKGVTTDTYEQLGSPRKGDYRRRRRVRLCAAPPSDPVDALVAVRRQAQEYRAPRKRAERPQPCKCRHVHCAQGADCELEHEVTIHCAKGHGVVVAAHYHAPRAASPTPAPAVLHLRRRGPNGGKIDSPTYLRTKAGQNSPHLAAPPAAEAVDEAAAVVTRISALMSRLPPAQAVETTTTYLHAAGAVAAACDDAPTRRKALAALEARAAAALEVAS